MSPGFWASRRATRSRAVVNEGGREVRPAGELAVDVAVQSAEEDAQPPDVAQRLRVAGAVHQPRRLAPGVGREAHEGLAQRHAVPAGGRARRVSQRTPACSR